METILQNLVPLFLIICIGYIAGYFKLLPRETGSILCNLLLRFCSPLLIFVNITESNVKDIFNLPFVLGVCLWETVMICILSLWYHFRKLRGSSLYLRCFGGFYGNIVYVGIPVFVTLFNNSAPVAITSLIHSAIVFPVFFFLLDANTNPNARFSLRECLFVIVRNPIIFLALIASALLWLGIPVPLVIRNTCRQLGTPASALGLFALGFTCNYGGEVRLEWKFIKPALISIFFKQLIGPVSAFLLGRFVLGLEPFWTTALVMMSMLPIAMNYFIVAQRYDVDVEIARTSVILSTFLFSGTICLYILLIGI